MIQLKRVYEEAKAKDGKRLLIERLWPRGMKKSTLKLDAWIKEAGPSSGLRRWFSHDPAKWNEFRHRYFAELGSKRAVWEPILKAASQGQVTLLYSSHDEEHNNAVALKEYLDSKIAKANRKTAPVRKHAA